MEFFDEDEKEEVLDNSNIIPRMTMEEKVVIITKRIIQLNNGYKSTIEDVVKEKGLQKSYDIAMEEFRMRKLPPYKIKRKFPNGTYQMVSDKDILFYPPEM